MSRADEQMMRRVAEMLASDDPVVVKEAIKRVSNNPRLTSPTVLRARCLTRGRLWSVNRYFDQSGNSHIWFATTTLSLVEVGTMECPQK